LSVRFPFFAKIRRNRRTAMAAAVVAITVPVTLATAASAFGAPAAADRASGLRWASGVYLPDATRASVARFGAWRGRPVNVVTAYDNLATWNDITDPAFLYKQWKGTSKTLALGVAMLPQNVPGVSLQACADGSYDSHWRQFGANIAAYGLGRSIIRLGWEFNGNWYAWRATRPVTWAACWRQIVTSARETAPGLRWDWNVNRGVSSALADPAQAYPGNAYVTTVGIDSFDMWPGATAAANWQRQLNGPQGLNYWLSFARAHGKKFAVPEWGNVTTGRSPGGDNRAYVKDMLGFFKANAASIAYESNFQGTKAGGNYGTNGHYGGTHTRVPRAAAAYKASF
jgi:hypothetical protein